MCDPVTLGSMALAATGALMQAKASADSARSVNDAQVANAGARTAATDASAASRQAELGRQQSLQETQSGTLADAIARQGQPAQATAMADATANRLAMYDRSGTESLMPAASGITGTGKAPAVVGDNIGDMLAKVGDYESGLDAAKAKLGGASDLNFLNGINLGHSGQAIDLLGGFRSGSANTQQQEQQAISDQLGYADDTTQAKLAMAPFVSGGLRTAGGVAQGLGNVGAVAAARGGLTADKISNWFSPSSGMDWLGSPSGVSSRAPTNLSFGGPH